MQQLYIGWRIPGFRKFLRILQSYDLSSEAQYRLSVLQWHFGVGEESTVATARHFGLHRNTIGKWLKRFNPRNPQSLEPKPRAPIRTYRKTHPIEYTQKAVALKKQFPYYGKEKISRILKRDHGIVVSASWVGTVIKAHKLQYLWRTAESACRFKKTIKKRHPRKRPPALNVPEKSGTWIQIDTVVLYSQGNRVYVICAVDLTSRFGIACAYNTPSSANATEFLKKVQLFFTGTIALKMVQTDNGSEFMKHFDAACIAMNIEHTFSKVRSPKMNAFVERFNETIQIECLKKTDALMPVWLLNQKIQAWLLEYNTYRPHASLDYRTPLDEYIAQLHPSDSKVHTMYVTHTSLQNIFSRAKILI
jgi:transposase InsO family protein